MTAASIFRFVLEQRQWAYCCWCKW